MGWKHYQTVDPLPPKRIESPKLVGTVLRPSTNSSLQISIFQIIKSSTFRIFLFYPFRKNISFTQWPKIAQKFTQNRQKVANEISREI